MLPRINRLTKKKDFQAVFQKGKSIKYDFLLCKTLKNNLKKAVLVLLSVRRFPTKPFKGTKLKED